MTYCIIITCTTSQVDDVNICRCTFKKTFITDRYGDEFYCVHWNLNNREYPALLCTCKYYISYDKYYTSKQNIVVGIIYFHIGSCFLCDKTIPVCGFGLCQYFWYIYFKNFNIRTNVFMKKQKYFSRVRIHFLD